MRGIAAGGARDTRRAGTAVEDPALPGWRKGGACRILACQSARWIVSRNRSCHGVRIVSLTVALEGRRASESSHRHPASLPREASAAELSRPDALAGYRPHLSIRASRRGRSCHSKSSAGARAEKRKTGGPQSAVVGHDPAMPRLLENGPQRLIAAFAGFGNERFRLRLSNAVCRIISLVDDLAFCECCHKLH